MSVLRMIAQDDSVMANLCIFHSPCVPLCSHVWSGLLPSESVQQLVCVNLDDLSTLTSSQVDCSFPRCGFPF